MCVEGIGREREGKDRRGNGGEAVNKGGLMARVWRVGRDCRREKESPTPVVERALETSGIKGSLVAWAAKRSRGRPHLEV